jgi:hypothetical protein
MTGHAITGASVMSYRFWWDEFNIEHIAVITARDLTDAEKKSLKQRRR